MSPRLAVAVMAAAAAVCALTACGSESPAAGPEGILATITTPPRTATATPAPSPTPSASSAAPDGWYLALGDSLAVGMQPTTGDQPTRGYAGPVLAGLRQKAPGLGLKSLGCSGETTTSMLRGGLCKYPEGSQIAAAVAFLKDHADNTRLVTLDLGANNVIRCVKTAIDQACATTGTSTAAQDLGSILGQLREVAPKVPFVVLNYYNPFLAGWVQGGDAKKVAADTQPLLGGLNGVIANAAKAAGAKVADVAAAFATDNGTGAPQPVNVQRICTWTWMCSKTDIHANDEGYAAMAKAVLAVV